MAAQMRSFSSLCAALSLLAATSACSQDELKEAAKDAAVATKKRADDAVEAAKKAEKHARKAAKVAERRAGEAADAAKEAAAVTKERADEAVDAAKDRAAAAKQWVAEHQPSGELSPETKALLSSSDKGIARTVAKGEQLAPVALEVAETAYSSTARDFHVEAIYQSIDGAAAKRRVARQIAAMPRTETIDDTLVGFEALGKGGKKAGARSKAYLVVWVQGEHLAGFVYSSPKEIDVEQLVTVMPTVLKKAKTLR